MRDAAGELPDRFDLLGVEELILEGSPLGDVQHDALEALRFGPIRGQADRVVAEPDDAAVARQQTVLAAHLVALAAAARALFQDVLPVVRVQPRVEEARVGEPLFDREAEQRLDAGADEEPAAFDSRLGDVGDGRQLLEEDAELRLFPRQRLLRAQPLLHLRRERAVRRFELGGARRHAGLEVDLVAAQLRVGLQELVGGEVERAFEHRAVGVRLHVGGVDRRHESPHPRIRQALLVEEAAQLAAQERVHGPPQISARAVMVMVWLWSSQVAPGRSGEISP